MTAATITLPAVDSPEVAAIIELGARLIRVAFDYDSEVAIKLDAMLSSYCGIVAAHPQLAEAAQRSLLSAARAMVGGASACAAHPPVAPHIH